MKYIHLAKTRMYLLIDNDNDYTAWYADCIYIVLISNGIA